MPSYTLRGPKPDARLTVFADVPEEMFGKLMAEVRALRDQGFVVTGMRINELGLGFQRAHIKYRKPKPGDSF